MPDKDELIKEIEDLLTREPCARRLLGNTNWRELDVLALVYLQRQIAGVIVLTEGLWP